MIDGLLYLNAETAEAERRAEEEKGFVRNGPVVSLDAGSRVLSDENSDCFL